MHYKQIIALADFNCAFPSSAKLSSEYHLISYTVPHFDSYILFQI